MFNIGEKTKDFKAPAVPKSSTGGRCAPAAVPIAFTQFSSKLADTKRCRKVQSLAEVGEIIRSARAPNKEQLPWLKLAGFGNEPSDKECLRYDANVTALWGAELDYDGGLISIEEAAAALAGVEALLYETASSTPQRPRWRTLCPASRSYKGPTAKLRDLRAQWVARVNGLLGGVIAGESFNLSQAFYVGTVESKPPVTVIITEGARIDTLDRLDPGAIYKNGKDQPTRRLTHAPVPDDLTESDDDPRLIAEGRSRVANHVRKFGPGTAPMGNREFQLVSWLGDMRTYSGLILSAEAIADFIEDACPMTQLADIEDMLARRENERGCELIVLPAEQAAKGVTAEPKQPSQGTAGWISAAEAAVRLEQEMSGFFQDPKGKIRFINSRAGLGKTETAINAALRYTTGWRPEDMNTPLLHQDLSYIPREPRQVAFAVPRHSLANELQANAETKLHAAEWYDKIPVMRGRSQGLCKRSREAAALADKGLPIYGNLCDSSKGRCPHFHGCPHLAQSREATGAPIGIVTHAHLATDKWDATNDFYWNLASSDTVVIDEAQISSLGEMKELTTADVEELGKLLDLDIIAELTGHRLLTTLADKGWTDEKLRAVARRKEIAEDRLGYVLNPAAPDESLGGQIANLKPLRRLAPTINRLADELASGRGGASYSLLLKDEKVIAQGRRDLPIESALFLDATGNPLILRQFFKNLEARPPLKVRRNARVTQVIDRTFSRSQLLKAGKETEQLEQAKRFIALKAHDLKEQGGSLLVGTDKKVRTRLTGETKEELKRTSGRALGADIAHFANVRGSNDFEEHAAVIVLGRDQPKLEDAEQLAMAIFYDTPEPIKFAERDAKGRANYSLVEREYQMRDGSRVKGKCSAHLDARVQAVIEQVREAGMIQMIDRLRLLHNREPKEVVILCSIPLDIEVDRLVTWEELAGNQRLNKLLDMCAAEGLAAGPLTPSWLAERKQFRDAKSAENWRLNSQVVDLLMKSSNPKNAIKSIRMGNLVLFGVPSHAWEPEVATWRLVEYRPAGRRGRWSNAAVCGLDARAAIAQALGVPESTLELRKPVWREPHIVEEPLADPIAIIVTTPKRAWPRPHIVVEPSMKPISFVQLLRPDEGEGVLLTELACQSDWAVVSEAEGTFSWRGKTQSGITSTRMAGTGASNGGSATT